MGHMPGPHSRSREGIYFAPRGREVVMFSKRKISVLLGASLVCGGLTLSPMATAETAPLSNVASPEIYKVLAENELFRVVLATWQPGQRDVQHSHPANAVYRLTDCKNKVYRPDGSIAREGELKAGTVGLQKPIESHSYQNVGDKVCQVVIVERK